MTAMTSLAPKSAGSSAPAPAQGSPSAIPVATARTTGAIAAAVGGRCLGRDDLPIDDLGALNAAGPRTLTFIRTEGFADKWSASRAGAALVTRGLTVPGHDPASRCLIEVDDADHALIKALELFSPPPTSYPPGVHPSAAIDPSAKIASSAHVGPFCFIGPGASIADGAVLVSHVHIGAGASIGPRTVIHPRVAVLDRCAVGAMCILWPGVVIGADGFGYRPSPSGPAKIPHIGNVVVGNMVEIGGNTCIDRGKFGPTTIGDATKIDNLVQIGHNCRIGRGVIICGACAIAGSVTIEDGCILAGQSGVADNLTVGKGAVISAKAGVMANVPAGETWFGVPAGPHKDQMRAFAALRKLSDHLRLLRKIERSAAFQKHLAASRAQTGGD